MFIWFRVTALSLAMMTLLSGGVRAACVSFNDYAYGDNPSKRGYEIAWTGYDEQGDLNILWQHSVSKNWIMMYFLNTTQQVCSARAGRNSRTRILGLDI